VRPIVSNHPTTSTLQVTWADPRPALEASRDLSGLEYLQALRDGRFPPPPFAALVGFDLVEVDEGSATFVTTPSQQHVNPLGSIHGGLALAVLDSACGCAVHTRLAAGEGYTTIEIKTNFVRPVAPESGQLVCKAAVLHLGRRTALAEAQLRDAGERLVAHAVATLAVSRG